VSEIAYPSPSRDRCPECVRTVDGPFPNYDHVHMVRALPRRRRSDAHVIIRGYATDIGGAVGHLWVFFEDVEPAVVFGRAGRMSGYDIKGWGVHEAAREARFDPRSGADVVTLYVNLEVRLRDDTSAERRMLERWVRGCDPQSSYYSPGGRRT